VHRLRGRAGAADTIRAVPSAALYPDTAPFRTHDLAVGDGHVLHVQEHGRPDGQPALVLHGGPGSGCSPLLRRFFDPAQYRVICVDQRGAGLSRPRGGIEHNTTAHLLADLRLLRTQLGLSRWLVVGGSWGATLALAHAADDPQAIAGLLLRSTFLARAQDIRAFFDDDERLPSWARTLAHGEPVDRRRVALAWWQREQLASGLDAGAPPAGETLDALVDRYRVQSHYLMHRCWLDAPTLLERCEAVPRMPILLLHGRDDRVCPPEGAAALHARLPHSALHWVDGAGHDPSHPAMVTAMTAALDGYAAQRHFGAPP
jgi:proline iminopeptidase